MAYSTTINGIGVGIDPYVPVSVGPSGQQADFQSDVGTNSSRTITISLDKNANNFSIDIVGPSVAGNTVIGYNAAGQEIARAAASFVTPGTGPDTTYNLAITSPSGETFRSIRLVPADRDYVAYHNMVISGIAPTTVSNPTSTTVAVDLSKMIQVSVAEIDRLYVKNSFAPIAPQDIVLRNTSDIMDINVGLRGIAGVSFSPNILQLNRGQAKTVTVAFDVSQLNSLGEGINTITAICDLSSGTTIVPPGPPPVPPFIPPIPPVIPTTPPEQTDVWLEERFAGAPMGVLGSILGFSLEQIFARGPFSTNTIPTINYHGTFTAPMTVRWTGKWTFLGGTYQFNATTDDGMRVWVDGNLIIDSWKIQGATTYTRQLPMTAGVHDIRIEYFNGQGDSSAAFAFVQLVTTRPPIPGSGNSPTPNPTGTGNSPAPNPVGQTPPPRPNPVPNAAVSLFQRLFGNG